MIRWCVALLLVAGASAQSYQIDIEEVDQAFEGKFEVFKQFEFDLIACARNFAIRKDISVFTYNAHKRQCHGFTSITGYGKAVEGTKTYFVRNDEVSYEQFLKTLFCADGWESFRDRCYKKITVRYIADEKEAQNLVKNGCAKETGVPSANAVSIHSDGEAKFIADRTTKGYRTLIGLLAPLNNTTNFKWTDGTEWDYKNWAKNEPNHHKAQEFLVELVANGKWNDILYKADQIVDLWCYYRKSMQ